MTRKIIVTGGCGYVGSHVARAFKQNNDQVYIFDRVRREHTLKDMDGWYIDDFSSDAGLATIIDLDPDVIVHCAGTSLVGPSMLSPSEYYNNNVVSTIKMLDIIKDLPKKPLIIFSSSASVYGEPREIPIREDHAINPLSPYGNTKATIESLLVDYSRAYKIPSVRFRFFNAAGAEPFNFDLGQEPGASHIIARILESSLSSNLAPFILNGDKYPTKDGTCVRDYIHVWDVALAHILATHFMFSNNNPGSFVFNLGTNSGVSNKEIINYVSSYYGLPGGVTHGPARFGDPAILIADATEAKTTLGWTPKYSDLGTMIASAYRWYQRKI